MNAALFSKSIADATRAGEIIEQDAKSIADTMKSVHGGVWRIQIDHEVQFVMIVRDFPDAETMTKPGRRS